MIRKPFKSNITAVFEWWTGETSMQKSSHSFMRNGKNSLLIYDRFDRNSLAVMLEKSMLDWIRRGKPVRKNMYYHYGAFLSSWLNLLQAWSFSHSFNFPPTFACLLTAVFSFLVRFFCFFELAHGHSVLSISTDSRRFSLATSLREVGYFFP